MKIKNKIVTLFAVLGLLTSCSDALDPTTPTYTVGEADNAIVLRAGIGEGGASVQTRAGAEDNHNATTDGGGHTLFTTGTMARLRVDGRWKSTADGSPTDIRKTTTITLGGASATEGNGTKHNSVTGYDPQLYWDDYGTADPHNVSAGRAQGLTIYGAAVDGYKNGQTAALPNGLSSLDVTPSNWQSLSWNVGLVSNNAINQKTGWSNYDLLTSNNVVYNSDQEKDNAYKFESRANGKLLEFTHAMTKVTVELTAGKGFVDAKFVNKPEVTLLNFNYMGTVNVETKTSTATATDGTNTSSPAIANIEACINNNATWASANKATATALVFPGNSFNNDVNILKIVADGNEYLVNATMINAANTESSNKFEQAKNYILKITINKTGIDKIEATVKNWVSVEAANDEPVISISDVYGQAGTTSPDNGFKKNFDFYRSTSVSGSYLESGNHTTVTYTDASGGDPAKYTMNTQLYWPDHQTHYFFRGIWPLVGSQDNNSNPIGPASSQVKVNSIEVQNVAYKQGYYPSDLMIGMPRKSEGKPDETCKVTSHTKTTGTANGICATEGAIHMNFQYAMSQVIVELKTSEGANAVIFDDKTKVEILDGYTQGEIKLSDESSDFTGKSRAVYVMNKIGDTDYDSYHDAIIPQSLIDGSNPTLKFRITVKSRNDVNDQDVDTYETVLGIRDIEVTESGSSTKHKIDNWEPGKKYTYTLTITKTGIKVEATVKDWITVEASENVWF